MNAPRAMAPELLLSTLSRENMMLVLVSKLDGLGEMKERNLMEGMRVMDLKIS